MTMQFIRCSAWFGSVRFGFLAPAIFIRIGFVFLFPIRVNSGRNISLKSNYVKFATSLQNHLLRYTFRRLDFDNSIYEMTINHVV